MKQQDLVAMPLLPPPPSHTKRGWGGSGTRLAEQLLQHHRQRVGKCVSRAKIINPSAGRVSESNFQMTTGLGQTTLLHTSPFRRCLSLFYTSPNPLQLILRCCNFPQHSFRAGFGNTHVMSCLRLHRYPHPTSGSLNTCTLGRSVLTQQDRAKQLELPRGNVL